MFVVIGHLLFLGLLILAGKHYLLRCVHVDSAFQIFSWVNNGAVGVEAYRFSAVIPQMAVKVFRAFGADLRGLLMVASLAHVLVPYAIFVLAAHVWRVRWVAAGCALAAVLCTRLTFYGIVLEANYLLCYPFLLAAILHGPLRKNANWRSMALSLFALFMVVSVHPVGFLVALFVLALFWSELTDRRKELAGLGLCAVLWGGLSRVFFPPSGYESKLYDAAGEGLGQVGRLTTMPSLDFLIGHTWGYTTHYLLAWVLLIGLIAFLVYRRNWFLAFVVLGSAVGYVLMNVLTYHQGEVAMMMEKNFLPLATIIALPLLLTVGGSAERMQWWAVTPFLLVVFIQFRGISFASRQAHERFDHIEQLVKELQDADIQNALVPATMLDQAGLHIHWALPFETLLLSASEGSERSVIAYAADQNWSVAGPSKLYLQLSNDQNAFSSIRSNYFKLPLKPLQRYSPTLLIQD